MLRLALAALLAFPGIALGAGSSYIPSPIEGVSGGGAFIEGDLTVGGTIYGAVIGETTSFADAPILGDGGSLDHLRLDTSSVTLLGPTVDHSELTNIAVDDHHTPTVDTNAQTICSGSESLRGDGTCVVPAGDAANLIQPFFRDDFTHLADGIETDFAISTTSADNSLLVIMDGLAQQLTTDYTITGTLISFATAPAADTGSLYAVYPASIPVITESALDTHAANPLGHSGRMFVVHEDKSTNSASYTPLSDFVYPGSADVGAFDHAYVNYFRSSGSGSCDIRIYDATNALVIAEVTGITTASPVNIIKIDPLANIPSGSALIEIQAKRSGGGTNCDLTTTTVEF